MGLSRIAILALLLAPAAATQAHPPEDRWD